ncbi:hypothetical protein EAH75_05125 [Rhodanobacter glycinis]|uniref:Uncharacterized protein n=1 Tax=Rhodanobacter glycinis TaxID=582702 RepID=A0A502C9L4_9GAMM|nr:hypothetical protein EAH88_08025 [Rhodanobacter glycinis]TPG50805.1 hypothetical protein EAH75_05125 [Rhodanobacter glycinis]
MTSRRRSRPVRISKRPRLRGLFIPLLVRAGRGLVQASRAFELRERFSQLVSTRVWCLPGSVSGNAEPFH